MSDLWNIDMPWFTPIEPMPPINGNQNFEAVAPINLWKKQKNLNSEPNNISVWGLFSKILIGFIVGVVIAALLFVVLSFVWSMFTESIQQQGPWSSINPLLRVILLFIGFLSSFIGNMIIAGMYNLFFNKKYYDISKMFGFLLLTNAILFLVLFPIYLLFKNDVNTLFFVLWFHVLFSVFISSSQVEFLSNPNYSGSAFMGNILGFALAMLIYAIVHKFAKLESVQQQTYYLMLLPSILWFTFIPIGSGIWEKIYYGMYTMWSNAFYIPSISEVANVEETEEIEAEQINVDI